MGRVLVLVLALGGGCRRAAPPEATAPIGNVGSAAAGSGSAATGSGSGSATACFDDCMAARQMEATGIEQIRAGCRAQCAAPAGAARP